MKFLIILNKYKNIFKIFIDNLNIKSLNILKLINKKLYNIMPDFKKNFNKI